MLRIQDLPEGGGADGGKLVWFKLVTDDGQTQSLCLPQGQMQHFIGGLQRFADVARQQRAQMGDEPAPSPEHAYLVDEVESFPAAGHNMMLRFVVGKDVEFSFFLRPPVLKQLLTSVLHIQAPAPAPKAAKEG